MLFFGFNDYEGFKEIFGLRECGNGNKSRRNKILLALLKDKNFAKKMRETHWHYIEDESRPRIIRYIRKLDSMAGMRDYVLRLMRVEDVLDVAFSDGRRTYFNDIMDDGTYSFYSTKYQIAGGGVCWDGDFKSIRYKNIEADHIYKMKAGKFLRHLIEENPIGSILPEQVKVWLCEDFAERWQAYAQSKCPNTTLHIGDDLDDFRTIYDDNRYDGSFGSCMAGEGQYEFYRYAVDAKAAWLENQEGKIVARCVVFTDVRDESGKTWRLAERQYSTNGDNALKRMLVDKLIAGGHIDGYKQVGVDCHNARAYVANDGTDLSDKSFSIKCNLEDGDTLSYQDSFKYYDYNEHIAYNNSSKPHQFDLDTTDSTFRGDGYWSEYHQEFISEDDAYYVDHREDYFYRSDLRYCENTEQYEFCEDCVELIGGGYAYYGIECEGYDGVYYCDECGEYFLGDEGYYSEITEEDYCCEDCRHIAEQRYMERHKDEGFMYDDVNEEWFDARDEEHQMVRVLLWDWSRLCRKNGWTRLENKLNGLIFKYNRNWYYGSARYDNEINALVPRERVAC